MRIKKKKTLQYPKNKADTEAQKSWKKHIRLYFHMQKDRRLLPFYLKFLKGRRVEVFVGRRVEDLERLQKQLFPFAFVKIHQASRFLEKTVKVTSSENGSKNYFIVSKKYNSFVSQIENVLRP